MGCLILLLLAIPFLVLLWKYLSRQFGYFTERGVPHEKAYPLIGSLGRLLMQLDSNPDWLLNLATKYRGKKYFGLFDMQEPTYVLQDPALIKEVCIKHFDNFSNHVNFGNLDGDQLLNDALFFMRDQRWKDMRSTLSPAFTTSKMRMMWELIKEVAEESVRYINENVKNGRFEVDTKDFYTKISIDVIATCAFGLKTDTIRNPDNQVQHYSRKAFDFNSPAQQAKFFLATLSPKLANFLRLRLVPQDASDFFNKLVKDTLDHRKKTGAVRPDVLQLLLQALEGKLVHEKEEETDKDLEFSAIKEPTAPTTQAVKKNWTYDEIAAQCFLFFIAGNDTTATLLTFGSYELAFNQDKQDKLFEEIHATKVSLGDKPITYEVIQKLPYLDAVISEILRKHPPGFILDRECDKETKVSDDEGNNLIIPKGMHVWINAIGMHYDYRYFPNPERFEPERFLPENRDKIMPGTYIPFGVGPRACIGSRFALMEAKVVFYYILSEFKIEPCDKTMVPLRYAKGFQLNPEIPLVVEYKKR